MATLATPEQADGKKRCHAYLAMQDPPVGTWRQSKA
jgi:hypothetical protein